MFKTTAYYDRLTSFFSTPWWMYLLMGINFILLAVLIMLYPELLAYLVAGFLLFNGLLMVILAFRYRSLRKRNRGWQEEFWIEV
ncbi:hypothetical protein [Roseivirga sp. UBA838]|uniref:hypothetical protein n=1 Tax=Roseivirga sp. UBA838 TaxID=1947393 RepID=UPI00257CFD3A|nr:hypothetical protein [Roseivirga sp. UBA838]|tara:strand:- start:17484 stop:17735 length:252 start_codon:yes stop_codon:yes gene_type:complete